MRKRTGVDIDPSAGIGIVRGLSGGALDDVGAQEGKGGLLEAQAAMKTLKVERTTGSSEKAGLAGLSTEFGRLGNLHTDYSTLFSLREPGWRSLII